MKETIEYLSTYLFLPLLGLAVILVVIRFIKGPGLSDRVVALDLLVTIGIAIISIYSIATGQSTYLDIAMILALIAFLSTIAFAYYLKRRGSE
ncbi:MAG: cation:proton antiporter [Bacteroidota bacterium]|nr:cation:proton antiporter [Bacteroidota bacterium]